MKIDGTGELEPLDGTAKQHLESRRKQTQRSMAALRARETEEEKEMRRAKNRETQRRYRERCRERIAHRARRATVRRNAAAGKETKLRPKTRQYYSDPELLTEEEERGNDTIAREHTIARSDAVILLAEVARPNLKVFGKPVREELGDEVVHRLIMLSSPLSSGLDDEAECTAGGYLEGIFALFDWIGGSWGPAWRGASGEYVRMFCPHIISPLMSSRPLRTNLDASDMVMDHRGTRDPKYWCLPPFRGDAKRPPATRGYRYHLVWQGRTVGIFDTWAAADASLSGYPGSGNKGFHTIEECIDAWQTMCPLGVHPHPVEPTPPTKVEEPCSTVQLHSTLRTEGLSGSNKQDMGGGKKERAGTSIPTTPSPRSMPHVSFTVRGDGVISSSPVRARRRYEELQLLGEQPDILVTRSFARATLFALDDSREGETDENVIL
ncbi:hypothetical protein B0H14DRAFT_3465978 [Mycena olivaceomarginata]|nr:hypothetical protein B0H14DRAFT_3465978 [Mycena olivaceomarginata]